MGSRPKWVRVGMLVSVSPETVDREQYSYAASGSYHDAKHIAGYIWKVADRRKTPRDAVGVNWDHNWDADLILCKSLATGGYHYWWGEEIEQMKEEEHD